MFEQLAVFKMSSAMAIHAGKRQAIIAQNVANSDTPGYVARDIAPFQSLYESGQWSAHTGLHGNTNRGQALESFEVRDEASPNGNSVSLETEMLKSVDTKREHDRALAIYKSALNLLRTAIGK